MRQPYVFVLIIITSVCFAQKGQDTLALKPIIINASRLAEKQDVLPIAVSKINIESEQNIKQQLSFQEYLQEIPGLFSLNANNFSQDLRISIRGFGSRSAFGIRGIKLLVDGIPETTPDGQGQIDNLNLGIIKSIEVIRGPSSSIYGNASGGVISIQTLDSIHQPYIKSDLTIGSYNMQKLQVLSGFNLDNTNVILSGNYLKTEGYRNQSGFENYSVNLRAAHDFSDRSKLVFHSNYTDSPLAEDAGGLTLEELNADRRQARQSNINYKTEEAIHQFKLGATYNYKINENNSFNSYGFYATRDFEGKLPFEFGGLVDLNRVYFGNGSSLNFSSDFNKSKNRLQIGYDWAFQNDDRERFLNLEGDKGDQTLNQLERFSTLGLYALDHYYVGRFLIRAGFRYDFNSIKVADKFVSNGDDSGSRKLNAFNPSLGVSYQLTNNTSAFLGFSTSFETPVLSELSANPFTEGGFNDSLKAQKATNLEIGIKSNTKNQSLEAVLFYINTNDDLVPYELEEFPDRTFFRNAGSTIRIGLEFSYWRQLTKHLRLRSVYTFSDFKYNSYNIPSGDFKGKALPAIPKHKGLLSLLFQEEKFTAKLEGNYIGSLYANDANSTKIDGYTKVNLHIGYKAQLGKLELSPFLGIHNLFNTTYNDNIRINAFGGRYYEAAPKLNIFGGLRVTI